MDLGTMFGLANDLERLLNIPDEMVKMLQRPTRSYVKSAKAALRTPADIYEYPDRYSYVLDMPGLEPDDIKVTVAEGSLQVSGKKGKKHKQKTSISGQAAPAVAGEDVTMPREEPLHTPTEQKHQQQPLQTPPEQMQQPLQTPPEQKTPPQTQQLLQRQQQDQQESTGTEHSFIPAEGKPLHVERKKARHWRRFPLPEDADEKLIRALYKDGVLTVNVAKKPEEEKEKAKPRVVSIPVM